MAPPPTPQVALKKCMQTFCQCCTTFNEYVLAQAPPTSAAPPATTDVSRGGAACDFSSTVIFLISLLVLLGVALVVMSFCSIANLRRDAKLHRRTGATQQADARRDARQSGSSRAPARNRTQTTTLTTMTSTTTTVTSTQDESGGRERHVMVQPPPYSERDGSARLTPVESVARTLSPPPRYATTLTG